MKRLLYIIAALVPLVTYAEEWRLHPTFDGDLVRIIDTPDYTYFLSNNQPQVEGTSNNSEYSIGLWRYDKEAEELDWLSKTNMLSESVLQGAAYNPDKRYLAIAYTGGNIDLLYDNGQVVNIPGLKLAGSDYSKNVTGISFSPSTDEAFFTTDFGYFSINDIDGEIKYTSKFDKRVNGVGCIGNYLVLGMPEGLFIGPKNAKRFDEFKPFSDYTDVKRILHFDKDKILVWYGDGWGGTVKAITCDADGNLDEKFVQNTMIRSMEPTSDGAVISGYFDIMNVKKDLTTESKPLDESNRYAVVGQWKGNDYWISEGRDGLAIKSYMPENGWNYKLEGLFPNASTAFMSDNMVYHPKYGLLVRNHGNNARFQSQWVQTTDLVSSLNSLTWTPLSAAYKSPSEAFIQWNPNGIAVDPMNTDHIYSGSYTHGFMRLDLSDPSKSIRVGRKGDDAKGLPGYQGLWNDMSYILSCTISEPAFDTSGNLWFARHDYDKFKLGQNAIEILYWTPEDRAATVDVSTIRPFRNFKVSGIESSPWQRIIPFSSSSSKNIMLLMSGAYNGLMTFIDHKGTIENTDDDTVVTLNSLPTTDGGILDYTWLISSYEDPSTGLFWVGYDQGVFTLRPQDMLEGGSVSRIKVARNDGTGLADYLLDGVQVNWITADPSGRKWFSTMGGGIIITSADGSEIIKTYTSDNSPLPDNEVYCVCYNPDNNSMMISTAKGLVEMFLSSAASGSVSESDLKIYPNPVRPDYFGYVNIEGLPDNALVKVVDAGGNLIKELGLASGGEIQWDSTNLNSCRVPGGVYYIVASGSADGEKFSAVGKVLVVN